MNLVNVLRSGAVVRYHSTLIDKKQNNAEHQWETAVILCKIYPQAKAHLLMYALVHDGGEVLTGDIPAPVKKTHPAIKALFDELEKEYMRDELGLPEMNFSKEELLAIKYADVLSGIYFTTRRINAGDREASPIRSKWMEYIKSLPTLNDECDDAIKEILR